MRYLARAALIIVALSGGAAPAPARQGPPPPAPAVEYSGQAWKEFTSPEGGFSIRMAGTPKLEVSEADSPAGKYLIYTYSLETGTGGYVVMYADLPFYREGAAFAKAVFDAGRDKALSDHKMKLLAERDVGSADFAGREWLMEGGGWTVKDRALLVGGRLYQIILATPHNVAFRGGLPSPDPKEQTDLYASITKNFFGSFRLTPARAARPTSPEPPRVVAPAGSEPRAEITAGVLNGRAVSRPAPAYPAGAGAAGASGTVRVKIIVDESGRVAWAGAVEGHERLRGAAEEAARRATFRPTTLRGKPVKVAGFLVYEFVP